MTAELRWILLGFGLLLLVGIWWRGARRGGQAPGNAELRESSDASGSVMKPGPAREWTASPFEPLSIHTANFEAVPHLDEPMMVHPEPLDTADIDAQATAPPTASVPPGETALPVAEPAQSLSPGAAAMAPLGIAVPSAYTDAHNGHGAAAAAPQAPNDAEQQKIVTIRVCMLGEARLPGAQLAGALAAHGLAFGRYQVFHRKHVDGRTVFCVASMVEPGSFNMATMAEEQFRGVTLFAVFPGPLESVEAFDELITTARGLAGKLSAMVQDAKGIPLSAQRVAAMREDVARFQASLSKA